MKKTMTLRIAGLLLCAVFAAAHADAGADDRILFVVRHAERADAGGRSMMGSDPPLSPEGHARAKRLAEMLKPAHVKKIYVSDLKRTQQTAEPLASAEHAQIVVTPAKDVAALVARLRDQKGPALVVAHSDTLPDIVKRLGVKEDVHVGDDDYGTLFIVFRPDSGDPVLVRLHY